MVLLMWWGLVIMTSWRSSLFIILFQNKYRLLKNTNNNCTESLQSLQPLKICKNLHIGQNSLILSEPYTYVWNVKYLPWQEWPLVRYTSSYIFCGKKHVPYYSASHFKTDGIWTWHDIKYHIHSRIGIY